MFVEEHVHYYMGYGMQGIQRNNVSVSGGFVIVHVPNVRLVVDHPPPFACNLCLNK